MNGIASASQPLARSLASAASPSAVGVDPEMSPLAASALQRLVAKAADTPTRSGEPAAAVARAAHGSYRLAMVKYSSSDLPPPVIVVLPRLMTIVAGKFTCASGSPTATPSMRPALSCSAAASAAPPPLETLQAIPMVLSSASLALLQTLSFGVSPYFWLS